MTQWNFPSDPANSRATNCVDNCFTCTVTTEGAWQCFVDYRGYHGHGLKGFRSNVDVSTSLLSMDHSLICLH